MSILKEFGEKVKVEKYMTEEFLKNAFSLMGEDSVTSIKIIKNKFTGKSFTVWKNDKFTLPEKIFREINSFGTYFDRMLLSRLFC